MTQRAKKPGTAKIRSAAFRRIRADHSSELAEDYVELIADLIDEKGEARGSEVAIRLGVANATVVKTMKRLQDLGLVTQEPYRSIFLTEEGWRMAEDGRRKHKIVEAFLLALGVSEDTARLDSEGIEHHVSEETLRAMARFLAQNAR
ncbi:manganese-binding transcriptional regulator MntR [Aestuariivirga sp.]|uniref:manganese-binding transcriptional regulator MntR n=1 Tax=Aestuariivirga sp. TaxID=2650926 RepID=UPI0039194F10